jgi:hypothetical protein
MIFRSQKTQKTEPRLFEDVKRAFMIIFQVCELLHVPHQAAAIA